MEEKYGGRRLETMFYYNFREGEGYRFDKATIPANDNGGILAFTFRALPSDFPSLPNRIDISGLVFLDGFIRFSEENTPLLSMSMLSSGLLYMGDLDKMLLGGHLLADGEDPVIIEGDYRGIYTPRKIRARFEDGGARDEIKLIQRTGIEHRFYADISGERVVVAYLYKCKPGAVYTFPLLPAEIYERRTDVLVELVRDYWNVKDEARKVDVRNEGRGRLVRVKD